MLRDSRIKCANAQVLVRADAKRPRADSNCPGADPTRPAADANGPETEPAVSSKQLVSLTAVAQQAQQGQFESIDGFARAAKRAVACICHAAEGRMLRLNRHQPSGLAG